MYELIKEKNEEDIQFNLALVLKKKITQQQIELISVVFKEKGFEIFKYQTKNKHIIFLRFTKLSQIITEAEKMRIQKEKLQEIMQKSHINNIRLALNRNLKKNLDFLNPKILKYENYEGINSLNLHKFIKECPKNIEDLDSVSASLKKDILAIFTSAELISINFSLFKKLRLFDLNIYDFLVSQKLMVGLYPLYEEGEISQKLKNIENVFGEKVALYFIFMKSYMKWLGIPVILGIAHFALNYFLKEYIFLILSDFLYSIGIIFWFTFFLIFWERKQSELSIQHGSYGKIFLVADKNKDFHAKEQINLVTGFPQEKYEKTKRFFWYFISFLEALPFLCLGLILKIIFLTLKGFILPGEMFFFETIGNSKKYFQDYDFLQIRLFLDILQMEATSKINNLYTTICYRSTIRENHRTNQSFESSFALKRFCFVFLNRFMHLAYIAFVKFDFSNLRKELTIIFVLDEIRRLLLESVFPLFLKLFTKKKNSKVLKEKQKNNEISSNIKEKVEELELNQYENFEDYLEIIIQMCYLVLFAGVFPQASYLCFFFNLIENKSDNFKLTYKCYKRPLPSKANTIGCWLWLLNIFSFCGIFTNTFIFSFNLYQFFQSDAQTNAVENPCDIWNKILIILLVSEHLIIVGILIIRYVIKSKPKWVRVFLKRQERNKMNYFE